MTDEQARGVHLTDKQIVFSVMAATVVAVVVFLCGVFVGRGVQALRPTSAEASAADGRLVPDTTVPLPDSDTGGAITAPPEKLTYYDRLGKPDPPNESLAGGSEAGPPEPPPDAPDSTIETAPPAAARTPPATAAPTTAPAVSPKAGTAAGSTAPAAAGRDIGAGETAAPYTVQLFAVTKKAEAQSLVNSALKKGFPAFVFTPPAGDPRGGYRVRVGSFKSRQEASVMASRLQKAGYSPWIIR